MKPVAVESSTPVNLSSKQASHHSGGFTRLRFHAYLGTCFLLLYLLHNEESHFHLYCYLMLAVVSGVVNWRGSLTQRTRPIRPQRRHAGQLNVSMCVCVCVYMKSYLSITLWGPAIFARGEFNFKSATTLWVDVNWIILVQSEILA